MITGIVFSKVVGTVGETAIVLPVGESDYSQEPRFYLAETPAGSSLLTLSNYAA